MNAPAAVDWGPALTVLAVGLAFGAVLVWRLLVTSRAAGRASKAVSLPARDLAGKRDALVRQLRELEDTASKRTPEQLARERYALELDAAHVLLELQERGIPAEAKRARHAGDKRRPARPDRAGLRGFLWGTASAAGVLLLGFFVYQSAKPRVAGGSVTGDTPMRERGADEAAPGVDEKQIQAALSRNPDDIEARLALAYLHMSRRDWMGVWNETGRVLQLNPGNPRALAFQGLVRLAMGQAGLAVDLLKKAIAADPDLADAYVYLALSYAQTGRMPEAQAAIAEGSRRFPDRAADLRRLLEDLQTREPALAATAVAEGNNPHAKVATPGEGPGAPDGRAAATPAGRHVSGTIDLDPSLQTAVDANAILFVFVRNAGASGGPPVAVKRLPAVFPAAFDLGEADTMMGQPFPKHVLIEARLDADGDPTTRPATDPKARLDGVRAGRTDLRLVLRR